MQQALMGEMIGADFFRRNPLRCARELVGSELIWGRCGGVIVETEAYNAIGDEACHCFVRPSTRAFVERNQTGAAYIYLNYGVHWMLNVLVKGTENGFVLIRALEPTRGIELMKRRRGIVDERQLCSGPGKLTQALDTRVEQIGPLPQNIEALVQALSDKLNHSDSTTRDQDWHVPVWQLISFKSAPKTTSKIVCLRTVRTTAA